MEKKTCLIALSFGMCAWRNNFGNINNFGLSNYWIAKTAFELKIPTIAQWEIATILTQMGDNPEARIEKQEGKYLNSYEVLIQAKKHMEELGYEDAILLGHQDHLPRIRLIAKKMGIKINGSNVFKDLSIPYDKRSTQWWTHNRFFFLSREIAVYIMLYLKRQI